MQNNDHPKVYVSSAKHANFLTKNTGWVDIASQCLLNAFRSDDWWHFVKRGAWGDLTTGHADCAENYVEANNSSPISQISNQQSWGEATGTPADTDNRLCGIPLATEGARGLREVANSSLADVLRHESFNVSDWPDNFTAYVPIGLKDELGALGYRPSAGDDAWGTNITGVWGGRDDAPDYNSTDTNTTVSEDEASQEGNSSSILTPISGESGPIGVEDVDPDAAQAIASELAKVNVQTAP